MCQQGPQRKWRGELTDLCGPSSIPVITVIGWSTGLMVALRCTVRFSGSSAMIKLKTCSITNQNYSDTFLRSISVFFPLQSLNTKGRKYRQPQGSHQSRETAYFQSPPMLIGTHPHLLFALTPSYITVTPSVNNVILKK